MATEEQSEYRKGYSAAFGDDARIPYWCWQWYSEQFMKGYHAGCKAMQEAFNLADNHRCDVEW